MPTHNQDLAQQIIAGDERNALTARKDADGLHLLCDGTVILTISRRSHPFVNVFQHDSVFIHSDPVRNNVIHCGSPDAAKAVCDILTRGYATTIREERVVHAIQVAFQTDDGSYLGIVTWPGIPDTDKTCARIVDSKKTWLTIRAGNAVNVRRSETKEWKTYRIKSITLWRVDPAKYNGLFVPCAQDWLDGTCVIAGR